MKKQYHKPRQTLRKFSQNGIITATNAIDGNAASSGIVGKNYRVRNYEIPDGIFKRELAEYLAQKQAV